MATPVGLCRRGSKRGHEGQNSCEGGQDLDLHQPMKRMASNESYQQQQQQQQLMSPELCFLHRLAQRTALDCFPEPVWLALAEFNVQMSRSFGTVPAASLTGYHSVTRQSKLMVLQRFLAANGIDAAHQHAMLAGQLPGVPLHLRMVHFLLERVLAPYPDAAVIKYSLRVPAFLQAWGAKWLGLNVSAGHGNTISFVSVHAFPPVNGASTSTDCFGSPGMLCGDQLVRTLYVPVFGC